MYQQPANSNSRKRPAPGTAPSEPMAPVQHRYGSPSNDMMRWHDPSDTGGFVSGGSQAVNPYGIMSAQPQQPQQQPYGQAPAATPNNTLARRQMNRALVPTASRSTFDPSGDAWSFVGNDPSTALLQSPQSNGANMPEEQSIEALEEAAAKAKQEAQSKRKQIPPFVQKLSSFLDEEKNVELIRWSDKGDSFIVLDEDEFAKTLIPELFKHNNYASFVRQLNMYGFHKRVGLSDNSMRASERKNKSPSEYSNPYFRRGHPNLLWLINKPKSGGKKKMPAKPAEGDVESEDEVPIEEPVLPDRIGNVPYPSRALPSAEMPVSSQLVGAIRDELGRIRDQQKTIMGAIDRMSRQNKDLYARAGFFQEQHDRHQASINAILSFLANVFRKTLEDPNGSQNVNDILANIIPGVGSNNSMHQGSVVDLGDIFQSQSGNAPMNQPKRARGLLPPIPGPNTGRASTVASTPSTNATPRPFNSNTSSHNSNANTLNHPSGTVEELFDSPDQPSPEYLAQELKSNPHESMMKIIQDTNANNNTGLDLPEVVANTPPTMTNDQRQMLNNMMAHSAAPGSSSVPAAAPKNPTMPVDPQPAAHAPQPDLSLSPALGSHPQAGPFGNVDFESSNNDLETLQRMSQDTDRKIQNLQSMIGPLSPSGRIPDLDGADLGPNYFNSPSPGLFDMESWVNSDAFVNNGSADFGGNLHGDEFDFGLAPDTDTSHLTGLGVSNPIDGINNTPSPSGTEEIQRDEQGDADPRGTKRRRMND